MNWGRYSAVQPRPSVEQPYSQPGGVSLRDSFNTVLVFNARISLMQLERWVGCLVG